VLLVALGMVLGLVTAPSKSDLVRKRRESVHYTAVHTLEATGSKSKQALPRLVLESSVGDVPTAVAKKLGDADPSNVITGRVGPKSGASTKSASGGSSLSGSFHIGSTDVTVEADPSSGAVQVKAEDEHAKRAEVVADDVEGMLREGRHFAKLASNIFVKIPMTENGLEAIARLADEGIRTN
jgi:hypothetical protein